MPRPAGGELSKDVFEVLSPLFESEKNEIGPDGRVEDIGAKVLVGLGHHLDEQLVGPASVAILHALGVADLREGVADVAWAVAVAPHRRDETGLAGPRRELFRGVVGNELPLGDDEDAPTGHLHLGEVVRGEDDRPLSADFPNELTDFGGLVRIEPAHRLVQDQDRRLVNQRLGEPDALPKALRELANALANDVAKAGLLDDLAKPRPEPFAAQPAHLAGELEVLEHQHFGVERGALWEVPDRLTDRDRVVEDVCAAHACSSPGRGDEAREYLHRRRLAGPVWAKKTNDLPALDFKCCVLEGGDRSVVLRQVPCLDHHIAHKLPRV